MRTSVFCTASPITWCPCASIALGDLPGDSALNFIDRGWQAKIEGRLVDIRHREPRLALFQMPDRRGDGMRSRDFGARLVGKGLWEIGITRAQPQRIGKAVRQVARLGDNGRNNLCHPLAHSGPMPRRAFASARTALRSRPTAAAVSCHPA
jgi:hypothetical protein